MKESKGRAYDRTPGCGSLRNGLKEVSGSRNRIQLLFLSIIIDDGGTVELVVVGTPSEHRVYLSVVPGEDGLKVRGQDTLNIHVQDVPHVLGNPEILYGCMLLLLSIFSTVGGMIELEDLVLLGRRNKHRLHSGSTMLPVSTLSDGLETINLESLVILVTADKDRVYFG